MIFGFVRHLLTRFAKTLGCFIFIAGLCVAAGIYQQFAPIIESVRYRPSSLLVERLSRLSSIYADSQDLVTKFKGTTDFPPKYADASFKPHFRQLYLSDHDFQDLHAQLTRVSTGKNQMKQFVTEHFEGLLTDIQQKLIAHAASLKSPADTNLQSPPVQQLALVPIFGLYGNSISTSEVESRKASLNSAKQFLGVLQASAENPENKKRLGDSIDELDALANLLPENIEPASSPLNVPAKPEPKVPLNAEKVAARLAQFRWNVRQALLSSWALDEADDRALQTAQEEQGKLTASEVQAARLANGLNLAIATAITVGVALGMLFLLIGDWTQKSSTEVLSRWCELIKDFNASPKEIYDIIERHVAAREVPELESTREFWHEGGALSAKREYLRLARERLVFEICAAPFGTGFFVSFRCCEIPLVVDPIAIFIILAVLGLAFVVLVSLFGSTWGVLILAFSLSLIVFLLRIAIARALSNVDRLLMKARLVAPLYEIFLRPVTYYRIDSTAMYLQAVQGATAEAFQSIFGDKGVDLLSETVSAPVLDEIYRKHF